MAQVRGDPRVRKFRRTGLDLILSSQITEPVTAGVERAIAGAANRFSQQLQGRTDLQPKLSYPGRITCGNIRVRQGFRATKTNDIRHCAISVLWSVKKKSDLM